MLYQTTNPATPATSPAPKTLPANVAPFPPRSPKPAVKRQFLPIHHELRAFRRSEALILAVYQATDAFPRSADDALARSLREMTTMISGFVLEGCSRTTPDQIHRSWSAAARLLEELAEGLDVADHLGLLRRDQVLELLEIQSGALVDVLILLHHAGESRNGGADLRAA